MTRQICFESGIDLVEMVRRIASLPLVFQPGSGWHYSVATDVVGRLIELIADMPLIDYLREKITESIGYDRYGVFCPSRQKGPLLCALWED